MQNAAKELFGLMKINLDKETFEDVLCVLNTVRQMHLPDFMLIEEALTIDALLLPYPVVSRAYLCYWNCYLPFTTLPIIDVTDIPPLS